MKRAILIFFLGISTLAITTKMVGENKSPTTEVKPLDETSPIELWEQGITPMAPQQYDGFNGLPQRVFFAGKATSLKPSGLAIPLTRLKKNQKKTQKAQEKRIPKSQKTSKRKKQKKRLQGRSSNLTKKNRTPASSHKRKRKHSPPKNKK